MAGSNTAKGLEESHWLCSIEDRRRLDSSREGMIEGLSVGSYLLLIDFTGRLFRDGKAAISAEWLESWNGWEATPKAGGLGSRSSVTADCWGDFSR